jgi:uncharacterized protein
MLVDIYTHFMPPQLLKSIESLGGRSGLVQRMAGTHELHDLDARFRAMDPIGDYRQIISLLNPPLETITTPVQGRDLARIANDAMAEVVLLHPDRFPAFVAALPFHDMDSNMDELRRAIAFANGGHDGLQVRAGVEI